MKACVVLLISAIALVCAMPCPATTYYVNGTTGDDSYDGLASTWDGTHGPKKTIQAGIDVSSDTDEVVVADGTYTGAGNRDVDFLGKVLTVRSENGAAATVVDCEGLGRGFVFQSGEGMFSILEGFTVCNGNAVSGGAIYCDHSSPKLKRCIFRDNSSYEGGAVFLDHGYVEVANCVITRNTATHDGGGLYLFLGSGELNNCTIVGNTAGSAGAICALQGQSVEINGCVLWGNGIDEVQVYNCNTTYLCCCDIQSGWDGPGEGNMTLPPKLSWDGHLRPGSPCIDFCATGEPRDIEMRSRPFDTIGTGFDGTRIYDVGAFEFEDVDSDSDGLPDWWELVYFQSATGADPYGDADDDDVTNIGEYENGTNAWNEDTDGDGRDDFEELENGTNPLWPDGPTPVYYVNGSTGNNAYDGYAPVWDGVHGPKETIQAAVNSVPYGWEYYVQVADGTYTGTGNRDVSITGKSIVVRSANGPDLCIIDCQGTEADPHRGFLVESTAFEDISIEGFTITGGYSPGATHSDRRGSAIRSEGEGYLTIEKCVVTDNTCSAIFVSGGSVTIRECDVVGNSGQGVGSIYLDYIRYGETAIVTDCLIAGNRSNYYGGGIFSYCSDLTVDNCVITGNKASGGGGGIHLLISPSTRITNTVLNGNVSTGSDFYHWGGGIGSTESDLHLFDRLFVCGNKSDSFGAGISMRWAAMNSVKNSAVAGNWSSSEGAGIYTSGQYENEVANCVVAYNQAASSGGGILWSSMVEGRVLTNNILWGNEPDELALEDFFYPPTFEYCDVEGGTGEDWLGEGCIDTDPGFAVGPSGTWTSGGVYDSAAYQVTFTDAGANWDVNEFAGMLLNPDTSQPLQFYIVGNTANTITVWVDWQTVDSGVSWVSSGASYQVYDYHLTAGSPCIDTGTNDAPDLVGYDLDGNHRVWFGETSWTVDMGAYEYGSVPLAVKSMSLTTEGYVEITWNSSVLPGASYTVLYSDGEYSDTMTWVVLQAGVPSGGSETSIVDATSPAGGHRYYRILDEAGE